MAVEVVALGVTINSEAQFAFVDLGSASLPAGTAFTVINNTAATPIAGTFSNLPDGSTFTSNGNSYAVDYRKRFDTDGCAVALDRLDAAPHLLIAL